MYYVFNDVRLHQYTGGQPRTLPELRTGYSLLAHERSPDGSEAWLNWIVRLRDGDAAIGTVQAGVVNHEAEIAWVIGIHWQGFGYAFESAHAMVRWFRTRGVTSLTAHIHPHHAASQAIARRLGLLQTRSVVDGEDVGHWDSID